MSSENSTTVTMDTASNGNISVSSNGTSSDISDISIDNLYPAIIQCFVIILSGYIAGRLNLLTLNQGKGIGTFVSYFCLPALLFENMCILDFSAVDWLFLAGVLISKSLVFLLVAMVTLIAKRPVNYGYAGLFGIFVTQSNDFALGYPIIQAIYEKSHPEYLKYIYLIAPISVVFLNPIGFAMLEMQKRKEVQSAMQQDSTDNSKFRNTCHLLFHVLKGVLTNPIVFMTLIGLVGNFIFSQKVPYIVSDILTVLGDAFSACALFYLGLNMVGKIKGQMGQGMIVPLLLIGIKAVMLPLITWYAVGTLERAKESNSSYPDSMSMFGFLYGTFPTAPSVFLYASHYSTASDLIATGMVAGTFLSSLLMFISAKSMAVVVGKEMYYKTVLSETSFDISIISMVCSVWVIVLLVLSQKVKRIPHQFLLCLIFSHIIACVGIILSKTIESAEYLPFVLTLTGILSARCWTAILAVTLYFLNCRSVCFVLRTRWIFYCIGFGLTLLIAGLLYLVASEKARVEIDPIFHYGIQQSALAVVVLLLCSTITIVSLILRHRNSRHRAQEETNSEDGCNNNDIISYVKDNAPDESGPLNDSGIYTICINCNGESSTDNDVEDIVPLIEQSIENEMTEESWTKFPTLLPNHTTQDIGICQTGKCSLAKRKRCIKFLRKYNRKKSLNGVAKRKPSDVGGKTTDEFETNRFTLLLITIQLSMFIGLFLCAWRLFDHSLTGIYVEIEFLDGVFNYGQGFLLLAIFGFDTKLIVAPCIKRWRRFIYGAESVKLPNISDLDEETIRHCAQFRKYHKENCARQIEKNMKYLLREYKKVFTGTSLCSWLIEVGLAEDRGEAVLYGKTLLIGKVICHVSNEHHFYDTNYFYRFVEDH